MKKTQKTSLFDTVSFDSEELRRAFYEQESSKMKLSKIATLVSIPVSIIMLVCIMASKSPALQSTAVADALAYILIILSIACSVICLGFSGIFKYVGRVIKWSWLLIPFFPVDLFMCMVNATFSIICIFIFPVIPCLFGLYQRKLNLKAAAQVI